MMMNENIAHSESRAREDDQAYDVVAAECSPDSGRQVRDPGRHRPLHNEHDVELRRNNKRMRMENDPAYVGTQESKVSLEERGGKGDKDTEDELTTRITTLVAKNEQLNADIDTLKRSFALREEQTNRLLLGLTTLNKMEHELVALQQEYQESSRKNVALIQEALKRITYCSTAVENLKRCESLTTIQLENFRKECNEEISTLVIKLNALEQRHDNIKEPQQSSLFAAQSKLQINNDGDELELLKKEVAACRLHLDEIEPRRAASESELVNGMKTFSRQLEALREQLVRLEQDVGQDKHSSHQSLENLLSRQMGHLREAQGEEARRMQQEMDELRSDVCEVLKEMHLLKERTKYLNPSYRTARAGVRRHDQNRSSGYNNNNNSGDLMAGHAAVDSNNMDAWTTCSSYHCDYSQGTRHCPHRHRDRHDHQHYCHFHCPHLTAARASGYFPYSSHPRSPSANSSSPRRPSEMNVLAFREADTSMLGGDSANKDRMNNAVNQSCPSPHYSSRSSSVSGRISISRGMESGSQWSSS